MIKIIRASRAGFCMGVSLALKKLESAIELNNPGQRICTLGPIIHNPQVLRHFQEQGVVCIDNPAEAGSGDFVLIRAHGIPRDAESLLRGSFARVEDATCPKVKKAQLAIEQGTAQGANLLLFGEETHPEVAGLMSYAANEGYVFGSREELAELDIDPEKAWVLAAQTTQDRHIFNQLAESLRSRLPKLHILNTICDATRERQEEAAELASRVDMMIVVGGRESGNTRRLASLSREAGIPTLHIETVCELRPEAIRPGMTVGLTAGASTPKSEIDAVEAWLKACA